jgi:hypothetical protein
LPDAAKLTTAFALAGLGGFNAHGAGFLAAASTCGVMPDLVTATSGQIVVLADWLQNKNLEESLVSPELEHNSVAQLAVLLTGERGVFRPAYLEALMRWWMPPSSMTNMLENLFDVLSAMSPIQGRRRQARWSHVSFRHGSRDREYGPLSRAGMSRLCGRPSAPILLGFPLHRGRTRVLRLDPIRRAS